VSHRLNLARRPFIDTRPVNVAAGLLAAVALVLTFVSVQTLIRYFDDSRKTRSAIETLREEISRLEAARRATEARLARFDLPDLEASAEDANEIALRRAFSWSRFLDRLEKTLPADVRVSSINLTGGEKRGVKNEASKDVYTVDLSLVSRSPDGLPKTIRAFYGSPWFDRPTPHTEDRGDKRAPDGRRFSLSTLYRDREDAR
jgi:Tfp pilus assembly protein PilN